MEDKQVPRETAPVDFASLPREWDQKADVLPSNPSGVISICDMTKTHLTQEPKWFPANHQCNVRDFIGRKGVLVLVSGDHAQVVQEFFVTPLGALDNPYFVISSGGSQIDLVQGGKTQALWAKEDISESSREELLNAALHVIRRVCHEKTVQFSPHEIRDCLMGSGCRIDVADRCGLRGPFFLEGRPVKFTLYAPASEGDSRESQILDQFASLPHVREVARACHLTVVRGADYVDVGTTKLEGLKQFASLPLASEMKLLDRWHVVLGDSSNDIGLFEWSRMMGPEGRATRVFVGEDDEVADELNAVGDPCFVYLRGGFVRATALVFRRLTGNGGL